MKSEYFTVIEEVAGATVSRVGSFTTLEVAEQLCAKKNELRERFPSYGSFKVVRSDLYETVEQFEIDERDELLKIAQGKLTGEEWKAIQYYITGGNL